MSETHNLDTNKYVCRYLQWAPHSRTSTPRPCPPGTSTTTTTPWPPTPSKTRSVRMPRMTSSTPSSSSWSPPRSSPGSLPSSLFSVSGNIWHCSVSKSKFFSFLQTSLSTGPRDLLTRTRAGDKMKFSDLGTNFRWQRMMEYWYNFRFLYSSIYWQLKFNQLSMGNPKLMVITLMKSTSNYNSWCFSRKLLITIRDPRDDDAL